MAPKVLQCVAHELEHTLTTVIDGLVWGKKAPKSRTARKSSPARRYTPHRASTRPTTVIVHVYAGGKVNENLSTQVPMRSASM
jgi:hypothetical protein